MMPEAARERSVSFRPRAPHSLRTIESTLATASLTERDSEINVSEIVTNVNGKVTRLLARHARDKSGHDDREIGGLTDHSLAPRHPADAAFEAPVDRLSAAEN